MTKFTKYLLLIFLFTFTLCSYAQEGKSTVIILHVNDLHGKIERFPALKFKVDSIRNIYDDVYLFSAGDLFSGNPFVDSHAKKGYPIIDLMNDVGFDASALGNHEFDYGQKILNERSKEAKFPILAANLNCKNSIYRQPKSHIILKTKSGISMGIVSLLQVDKTGYPATHPKNVKQIEFKDPFKVIESYKKELKNTDAQIALTHLGLDSDIKLAEKNQWLELVIGGHSHTTLSEPLKINNVIVTQAGSYLKYLGYNKIVFKNKKIISIENKLLNLINQQEDKLTLSKVKEYSNNPDFLQKIAFLPYTLQSKKEIGNLIAKAYKEELNVDIALQNLGGIRINKFPEGFIQKLDLMQLDPFNNEMITFKMYPYQIIEFLRYAHNLNRPEDIVASGITIKYIYNKDKELTNIKLIDSRNKPLIEEGLYTIAINSYMSESFKFSAKKKAEHSGFASNDLLINYFKRKFPIRN